MDPNVVDDDMRKDTRHGRRRQDGLLEYFYFALESPLVVLDGA